MKAHRPRHSQMPMLWLLAVMGCAHPGLPLEELSSEPIAFVYWDAADARERKELLDSYAGETGGPVRSGVARLDALSGMLVPGDSPLGQKQLSQYPGRIALLDPHSLDVTLFEGAPPNARPLAWSPDRRRLLFSSSHRDGGTTQLFEFDLERAEVIKLTRGPTFHLEADYGPDRQLVVSWILMREKRPEAGMEIRRVGGGSGEQLVEGLYVSGPRWSPKGDRLVFFDADSRQKRTETQRDRSSVVVQRAEPGSEPERLTQGREPVFSPDGEWIVYSSQTTKGWKLRRMRADGSGRTPVGSSVRDERFPAVSPDGRHVLYLSEENGLTRLYVRRMDGSGDRILLADGAAAFPIW